MGFFSVVIWAVVSVTLAIAGMSEGEEYKLTLYFLSLLSMCVAILSYLTVIYVEITKKH